MVDGCRWWVRWSAARDSDTHCGEPPTAEVGSREDYRKPPLRAAEPHPLKNNGFVADKALMLAQRVVSEDVAFAFHPYAEPCRSLLYSILRHHHHLHHHSKSRYKNKNKKHSNRNTNKIR